MDANGLRFWMLNQHDDWMTSAGSDTLYYCKKSNRLQLRSVSNAAPPNEDFNSAKGLVEAVPMTRDQFGNYARWDGDPSKQDASIKHILAGGSGPQGDLANRELRIYSSPQAVSDLAMGYDGILYIAQAGSLVMVDRRERWDPFTLTDPNFNFWRLVALQEGGVLALDRAMAQLGKVAGQPLPKGPQDAPNVGILRGCEPANPPRVVARFSLRNQDATQTPDAFVALTRMDDGKVALLSWKTASADNQTANLRIFSEAAGLSAPQQLSTLRWPYAIAWIGEQKFAVLATHQQDPQHQFPFKQALIFDLADAGGTLLQTGDSYILSDENVGPFVHAFDLPPSYADRTDMFPLVPLSLNSFAKSGVTGNIPSSFTTAAAVIAGSKVSISVPDSRAFQVGQQASIDSGAKQERFTVTDVSDRTSIVANKLANGHNAGVAIDPGAPRTFDSGAAQTVWHRVFMEAIIPPRCSVVVWLAASDNPTDLNTGGAAIWSPHVLGAADMSSTTAAPVAAGDNVVVSVADSSIFQVGQLAKLGALPEQEQFKIVAIPDATHIVASNLAGGHERGALLAGIDGTARMVWQSEASEVAFAPAILGEDPIAGSQGLFMALAQRAGTAVRSLRGRYLGIRVQLTGDKRSTPEIAALRVYGSRFSYVEHYLPEIYHEQRFGEEADQLGSSTRRDFFERFIDIFEAQLTRIEDRVANAYLLTRPESVPNASLDWLGSWIGLDPKGYPPDRRRARLLAAAELYRGTKSAPGGRGTAPGITQALDVATNGLCRRGAVIIIENFRLRHIFATILGANLAAQDDPLLPGYSASSNSIVGDTLFLGDPNNKDFLALFADAIQTAAGRQSVQTFYDELAHRITVFVHDQVEMVDLKLVQTIVEQEKPAHVMASVIRAQQALMIGLASLLGVNTYLTPKPPRGAATVNSSQIGRYDVITHVPSLDPRLDNGMSGSD